MCDKIILRFIFYNFKKNIHGGIKMKSLTPNLMVDDVNKTVDYYSKVLGFNLVMTVPQEGIFNWAMMKRDNVEIMFQERKNLINEYSALKDRTSGGGLTFFIKVGNVKELYDQLKGQVEITLDLHKTFYGSEEFAIIDMNGFVLTFAN
jgi:lactoylglutathione lyase